MDYPKSDATIGLVGGKFTDGNPGAGVPASRDPSSWANLLTDELLNVLAAAGIAPDEAVNTQVIDALHALGLRAASTSQTGVVQLADAATILAGTDIVKPPTAASLLAGLLGAGGLSTSDYVTIPFRDKTTGGRRNLILQWIQVNGSAAESNVMTLPITFPTGIIARAATLLDKSSGLLTGLTLMSNAGKAQLSTVQLSLKGWDAGGWSAAYIALGY